MQGSTAGSSEASGDMIKRHVEVARRIGSLVAWSNISGFSRRRRF
nr:hypothetical protein CDS [Bradyrhizobium sp.]